MRIHLAILLSLSACTDESQPARTLEAPAPDLSVLCAPECADPELVLEQLATDDRFVQLPAGDLLQYVTAGRQAGVPDPDLSFDGFIPLGECRLVRHELSGGGVLFIGGCR